MDEDARILAGYEADLASHDYIQRLVTLLYSDRQEVPPEVHEQLRRMLGREE
jgi:hypothetical protein